MERLKLAARGLLSFLSLLRACLLNVTNKAQSKRNKGAVIGVARRVPGIWRGGRGLQESDAYARVGLVLTEIAVCVYGRKIVKQLNKNGPTRGRP